MSDKVNMLRRLREIAEQLGSDLQWIEPGRRRAFVEACERERDAHLDDVLREKPEPRDLENARVVLRQLRGKPADAERAKALEAWMRRAYDG